MHPSLQDVGRHQILYTLARSSQISGEILVTNQTELFGEVVVDRNEFRHTENASGFISLIKCIMMLENDIMLPCVNFTKFNPSIEGSERLKVQSPPGSAYFPSSVRADNR